MATMKISRTGRCPLSERDVVCNVPCAWYNEEVKTCVIHLLADSLERLVDANINIAGRIRETVK